MSQRPCGSNRQGFMTNSMFCRDRGKLYLQEIMTFKTLFQCKTEKV
jgi:hypothetical protein